VFKPVVRPALHSISPLVAVGRLCRAGLYVNQSFFAIALPTFRYPCLRRHPILRFFSLPTIQHNSKFSANESQFTRVSPKSLARFRTSSTPGSFARSAPSPFPVVAVCICRACFIPASSLGFSAFRGLARFQASTVNLSRTPFGLPCPSFRSLKLSRWRFPCRLHVKVLASPAVPIRSGFIAPEFYFQPANNLPVALRLLPLILLTHHELKLRQVNHILCRRGADTLLRLTIRPPKHQILQRSVTSLTELALG